jgi:hypothetical protein
MKQIFYLRCTIVKTITKWSTMNWSLSKTIYGGGEGIERSTSLLQLIKHPNCQHMWIHYVNFKKIEFVFEKTYLQLEKSNLQL